MRRFLSLSLLSVVIALISAQLAAAQLYIPNKLFSAMYTDFGNMPGTTLNRPIFENITPFPSEYVIHETNITGAFPPSGEEGGMFERNEHVARFATNGETANGQATGHKFQRREAWDIAFDLKIETPNVSPRKEAGLYFKSSAGNAIFHALTNDTFYGTNPGDIGTIFVDDVMPFYSFSGGGGPVGDYNHNGVVDAPDYVIWRKTLGIRDDGVDPAEDMRANGNNDGESEDFIDQADYDVWRGAFGTGMPTDRAKYNVGDTVRMRLIYTPPVLTDPNLPDVIDDPNVATPGTMEYLISVNGGEELTSGPLDFTNAWKGIPKDTLIMMRVQNLGTAAVMNDSSKVTFSNFDFNGDLPGSGLPAGASLIAANVPEPGSLALVMLGAITALAASRRRVA